VTATPGSRASHPADTSAGFHFLPSCRILIAMNAAKALRRSVSTTRDRALNLVFERGGTRTSGLLSLQDLGIEVEEQEERTHYAPAGWLALRRVLRKSEVSGEDVFIDYGSGMGRVLLQAGRYPFRRIIGVELSTELHRIAQDNVERVGDRLTCKEIELVNSDAREYEVPDDVTVVFMYNPFVGHIFEDVVRRLVESLKRKPRVLRIIYGNPIEEPKLLAVGARPVRTAHGWRPTREWSRTKTFRLYELEAPR